MIEYIKGEISELSPARMVIECSGIGYELNLSLHSYSAYVVNKSAKVYVHEIIREDAHLLYGFATKNEREIFLLLTSVSGVGPNAARMILSAYPPSEVEQIIAGNNESALTSVKGIGQKTAQRIIVDLKNKVKTSDTAVSTLGASAMGNAHVVEEAVAALVMLGFQKAASQKVVISILKGSPALPVEQVIKSALRML